ncbi:NADH-quinone oxidoreductase subunit NuoK [Desulfurobacterium sp.]|nr:NADH-quinone oxidoreductase subunit NuoK [Desulfurobacterium sp. TC5-1]
MILSPLTMFQLTGALLFFIGATCMAFKRTFIGMLIGVEIMLNGAGLSLVASSQLTTADSATGQIGALLIMGLAAAEATLVLAIALIVYRRFKTVESEKVATLRG